MTLTQNDQEILNIIFNPNFSSSKIESIVEDEESLITNEEVKRLEIEAVKLAESTDPPSHHPLLSALNLINDAIELSEEYRDDSGLASLLNNKAQILRLLGMDAEALDCLNGLLSDKIIKSSKVLRQASAQRGWLHFRHGDLEAAFSDFERAGKLGCLESSRMAVRCNPYAAMCNQMLHEIIGSTFYTK